MNGGVLRSGSRYDGESETARAVRLELRRGLGTPRPVDCAETWFVHWAPPKEFNTESVRCQASPICIDLSNDDPPPSVPWYNGEFRNGQGIAGFGLGLRGKPQRVKIRSIRTGTQAREAEERLAPCTRFRRVLFRFACVSSCSVRGFVPEPEIFPPFRKSLLHGHDPGAIKNIPPQSRFIDHQE